MDPMMKILQ